MPITTLCKIAVRHPFMNQNSSASTRNKHIDIPMSPTFPFPTTLADIRFADLPSYSLIGPLAHQVVPHIHYHIIPRPPDPDMRYENPQNPPPAPLPQVTTDYHATWTIFGRGYRSSLEEDPRTPQLLKRLRNEIIKEFGRMDLQRSYQQPRS
jgi:hypothetical protein